MTNSSDQQQAAKAIVVPENIDAIRALAGTVTNGTESIRITDEAMGMRQDFLVR
jgi:glyceraldehyde-3-phosphate dehydrogenase (NAD(P))